MSVGNLDFVQTPLCFVPPIAEPVCDGQDHKALDAELRLSKVDCNSTSTTQPTTVATLLSVTDVHDPSDSADTDYLGTESTVTDPPANQGPFGLLMDAGLI